MSESHQQLIITVTSAVAEILADQLAELGALAVTLQAADSQEVFQLKPAETPLWEKVNVTALYDKAINLKKIINKLQTQFADQLLEYQIIMIPDQNWVRITQQQFPPQCYAGKLWIVPSWEMDSVHAENKVIIDPGLAFGTGNHPTTSLCLEWLATHDLKNKTVIDYGCGSGILALSALALGAKQVTAIDHDPQAIEATQNNALLNNFINKKNWCVSLASEVKKITADIIIANILANPLIELMPTLLAMLNPKGQLILSGILSEESEAVMQHYQSQAQLLQKVTREEWCRLDFEKRI